MKFKSTVCIVPGLGNSGEGHWQTLWEQQFGFERIVQSNWDTPDRNRWVDEMEFHLKDKIHRDVILVGHSLGCSAIAFWAEQSKKTVKGALLVAPSDTEAPTYPPGTTGFKPMPMFRINFPTIVVMSDDDYYVTKHRAKQFAETWGSELVSVGNAGHINVASGFGEWKSGLEILKRLDE